MNSSTLSEFYRNGIKTRKSVRSPPFGKSTFSSATGFDTDSTSDSDYSLQTKRSRRDSFESAFSYKKQYPPHISTADNDDVYKRLYSPPPVLTKHALHRPTATTHSDDDYEFYDDVDDDDEDDNDDEATWRERSGDKHIDLPVMLDHIFTNTHSNDLPFYAILTKFYDTTTNPMDLNIDKLYDFLQAEIKITNVEEHVQLDITQIIEAANRAYLNRMQQESDPLFKTLAEGTIQKLRNQQMALDELWRANLITMRAREQKRQLKSLELKKVKDRYRLDSQLYATTTEFQRGQEDAQALIGLDAFLDELKQTVKKERQ